MPQSRDQSRLKDGLSHNSIVKAIIAQKWKLNLEQEF